MTACSAACAPSRAVPPRLASEYDAPLGFAPLRLQHARRLAERGVAADPDQILLTNSASQSLDLLCRFLLEPGDAVLVDDPCYFNFLAMLRAHRVKAIGVPFTPEGPDVDAFASILAAHRPRFYLTIAGLHNPTGATISAGCRPSRAEARREARHRSSSRTIFSPISSRARAAIRRLRRVRPRDPGRQSVEDDFGGDPLRLYRRQA